MLAHCPLPAYALIGENHKKSTNMQNKHDDDHCIEYISAQIVTIMMLMMNVIITLKEYT